MACLLDPRYSLEDHIAVVAPLTIDEVKTHVIQSTVALVTAELQEQNSQSESSESQSQPENSSQPSSHEKGV